MARAVLDDDHRAVLEVTESLRRLFPLLRDAHGDLLRREHDRADRFGEVVDVQDGDALQLRHAVEAVVVRHDRHAELARERDELPIRAGRDRVRIEQLDLDRGLLLHPREHLEPTPSAFALGSIWRVREELQLGEDEARYDERAADEAALHDVGDASVDDDRGIEKRALRTGDAFTPALPYLARERAKLFTFDRARGHADRAEHDRADDRAEPAPVVR